MHDMHWTDFEAAAPELAAAGRERLVATHVALLGTLRADGSPRISPIEPYLVRRDLIFGVMKSAKAADLARDPRCAVHSAVSKPDGSEGEFKLFGKAVEVMDQELRSAEPEAWWMSFHPESAVVYRLDIESALFLRWNWDESTFETLSMLEGAGFEKRVRRYP